MQQVLVICGVVVVSGLILGRVLRPWAPRLADALRLSASALVRLLAATVLLLTGVALIDDGDPLRIGLAGLLFVVALAAALMAGLRVYSAAARRNDSSGDAQDS